MWKRQDPGGLSGHLVEVIERSRISLEHVTNALCDSGPSAASALPDAEKALYALRQAVDDQAVAIEATRVASPAVAVRTIVAAAQVNADAECVEGLARQLAEIAGSRPARPAAPAGVRAVVCRMGRVCVDMMAAAGSAGRSPRADTEARIEAADAEVRRLRQRLYRLLLHDPAPVDVDAALDASLACRHYTRCAELAVSMARHAILGGHSGQARQ
ncbi:PhoU domain-containing protein [Dactylosporangium sp. CA-233914]|uniref:PhoU domain-containing protein n=1 Tax=Dactylosporangium sp. CA-233914 TaxID=3239934 RepID=UPI003D8A8968